MKQTNSYKAVVALKSPGFLLGGAKQVESSAFVSRLDAQLWAVQCVETNRGCLGCQNDDIETRIIPVYSRNPIAPVNE